MSFMFFSDRYCICFGGGNWIYKVPTGASAGNIYLAESLLSSLGTVPRDAQHSYSPTPIFVESIHLVLDSTEICGEY